MDVSVVWRRRFSVFFSRILDFICIIVIYLTSELIIWGLSRALVPIHLEYFASILGMALTFTVMAVVYLFLHRSDFFYNRYIKSKVDFINSHLGLGFPVPLVMLNQNDVLNGKEIAYIIGNFIVTNLLSWTVVFGLSFAALILRMNLATWISQNHSTSPPPDTLQLSRTDVHWLSDSTSTSDRGVGDREKKTGYVTPDTEAEYIQPSSRKTTFEQDPHSCADSSRWWRFCAANFPILASLFGTFVVGVPLAAVSGEHRILDGFVLWFVWVSSVRLQRGFKASRSCLGAPRFKSALGTLMNPVLATTLVMIAYTRVKAVATTRLSLSRVLQIFSSGTPLYTLWTSAVTNNPPPNGAAEWFGAGDAALSILECGLVVWGFKLYECRRQLFSTAGLVTIVMSVAAAAGNVFLSVLLGSSMGLHQAEALAFAARSTTLALAKPAMGAVGGNLGANAALVVSNGILGQLLYPFMLTKLRVKTAGDTAPSNREDSDRGMFEPNPEPSDNQSNTSEGHYGSIGGDDPVTIAAGVTIGVNGAAMGVAYLYETKSRAAPYAALAMTVFGVMTVIFTTVEPFKGALIGLASQ